jgi:hypothetical protein
LLKLRGIQGSLLLLKLQLLRTLQGKVNSHRLLVLLTPLLLVVDMMQLLLSRMIRNSMLSLLLKELLPDLEHHLLQVLLLLLQLRLLLLLLLLMLHLLLLLLQDLCLLQSGWLRWSLRDTCMDMACRLQAD